MITSRSRLTQRKYRSGEQVWTDRTTQTVPCVGLHRNRRSTNSLTVGKDDLRGRESTYDRGFYGLLLLTLFISCERTDEVIVQSPEVV